MDVIFVDDHNVPARAFIILRSVNQRPHHHRPAVRTEKHASEECRARMSDTQNEHLMNDFFDV